jgi:hypothetical protein
MNPMTGNFQVEPEKYHDVVALVVVAVAAAAADCFGPQKAAFWEKNHRTKLSNLMFLSWSTERLS